MKNKEYVDVLMRITKEDAQKLKKGLLTFNNGLRSTKGNFNTRQPEFVSMSSSRLTKDVDWNNVFSVVNEFAPRVLEMADTFVLPWIEKRKTDKTAGKESQILETEPTLKTVLQESDSKHDNVVDFQKYKRASGE